MATPPQPPQPVSTGWLGRVAGALGSTLAMPFRWITGDSASQKLDAPELEELERLRLDAAWRDTHEKVHSGPAGVRLPAFLPFYDDQTQETGTMRRAYRLMWADPVVRSALLSKIFGVASLELRVQPAGKKRKKDRIVGKFVEWNLNRRLAGGASGMVWSIFSGGLPDGLSICEKVKEPQTEGRWAGRVVLSELKPKDVGNDIVPVVDSFRNITSIRGLRFNAGEEFSPSDFLIWQNLRLYGSPVGMSDHRAIYSRWWMLDSAWKISIIAAEKKALPLLAGSYKHPSQRVALESALGLAQSQWWLSLPEGVKIEVLNLAGQSETIFKSLREDLAQDIYLGLTGATLQSLTGGQGEQRGSSKVHKSTADLFKWWLSEQIHVILNDYKSGLVRWLVDLNFQVDDYPTAKLSAVDVEELQAELQIDLGLNKLVPLSKREVYDRYGRVAPNQLDPDDIIPPQTGATPMPPAGSSGGGGPPLPALPGGGQGGGAAPFTDQRAAGVPATPTFPARQFSERWQQYLRGEVR